MKTVTAFLFILAVSHPLRAEEPAATKPDAAFFTKLRIEYSKRDDFNPYWKLAEEREDVLRAMEVGNPAMIMERSAKWLAMCPVDADVHAIRSRAANDTGDLRNYVYHLYFAMGLMQSIMDSGDGQTPGTAWKVISIAEEYSILREIGAEVIGQSLIDGPCDRIQAKLPTGETKTYFFDVRIPMEAMGRKGKR